METSFHSCIQIDCKISYTDSKRLDNILILNIKISKTFHLKKTLWEKKFILLTFWIKKKRRRKVPVDTYTKKSYPELSHQTNSYIGSFFSLQTHRNRNTFFTFAMQMLIMYESHQTKLNFAKPGQWQTLIRLLACVGCVVCWPDCFYFSFAVQNVHELEYVVCKTTWLNYNLLYRWVTYIQYLLNSLCLFANCVLCLRKKRKSSKLVQKLKKEANVFIEYFW